MKKQILTLVLLSVGIVTFAQTYKGTVKDTQKKPVTFESELT